MKNTASMTPYHEVHVFTTSRGPVEAAIYNTVTHLVVRVEDDDDTRGSEWPLFIRREFSLEDARDWQRACGGDIWARMSNRSFAPLDMVKAESVKAAA